ncbi:hypothetical protein CQ022_07405 [Chryseobacterium culicis]|uniref:Uncharacterized protein n=1 Tax=Chryseobacterium culicis TaxID=680127 RepID=A0A2S9CZX3_CHRCI|nr:hypothetical protein CQ022_07405 [Chryseobacterium culicis]PRB91821.1 hypothetical protein CQ033_01075 [Chryseobacterium culicis]
MIEGLEAGRQRLEVICTADSFVLRTKSISDSSYNKNPVLIDTGFFYVPDCLNSVKKVLSS